MSKVKILITGAGGFIGKNLIKSWNGKYDLFAPKKNELNLLDKSSVQNYLADIKPNIVLHTANVGGNRRSSGLVNVATDNLRMFFNLTESKQYFDRLIMFGSGAEYDKRRSIMKIKEDDFGECVPIDEYGFAKYITSQYGKEVDYITHLRMFAVYGSFEDYSTRFISNIICKALFDLPIIIKQNVVFDYLYINDFARILDYFINNKPRHTFYNVGRGVPQDLVSIAERVLFLTGKNLSIIVQKPGLNNEYTCNVDRLKSEIGKFDYVDFDESLNEMIAFYQSILPQLDKNLFLTNV